MTMNPTPAAYARYFGFRYCETSAPAATPSAEVSTSAADEAKKIVQRAAAPRDANSNVASCVLSPSSAKNTVPNTVANSFQSMRLTLLQQAPQIGDGRMRARQIRCEHERVIREHAEATAVQDHRAADRRQAFF